MEKIKTFESFIGERRSRSRVWDRLRMPRIDKEKFKRSWEKAMDAMTGRKRRDDVLSMLTNDESAYNKFRRDPDYYVQQAGDPHEKEALNMIDKYNVGFTDLMGIYNDESDLRNIY